MESNIIIETEMTKEAYEASIQIFFKSDAYKKTFKRVVIISIFFVLCGIAGFVMGSGVDDFFMLMFGFAAIFVGIFGIILYKPIVRSKARERARKTLKDNGVIIMHYELSMDGIKVVTSTREGLNKWPVFNKWGEYEDFIYIRMGAGSGIVLINNSSLSKSDRAELYGLLAENDIIKEKL